jgi:hypothetical protein
MYKNGVLAGVSAGNRRSAVSILDNLAQFGKVLLGVMGSNVFDRRRL